jgi:hypothetical protein
MFKWKKLGLAFSPQDSSGFPWMKEFAQAPASLLYDNFVRMYFSCRPAADNRGQYVSYSAFVDLDRANPLRVLRVSTTPIMKLGDLGTFDEFGTYPVSVTRNGSEIWAYYGGWTRCESVPFNVAIGLAISRDGGDSFERLGGGPVISYSVDEPFVISGPKVRRYEESWLLWYIAGRKWKMVNGRAEPVYKIRMARSADGINWEKEGRDLIQSRIEPDEAQASPDVIYANGKYHMFFSYRFSEGFRTSERGYRIGYASSENLRDWVRDDGKAGIGVSDTGWDSEMVCYPHVFELDGKTYMAYLGNEVGRYGFGLALLEGALE